MNALRREWGAVTFVVTILIGAVAVAISLGVSASHGTPIAVGAALPVVHAVRGHADPGADRHAEAHGERQGDPDGDAHDPVPTPVATPTPFNPQLQGCPTAPLPPTAVPTPTPKTTPTAVGATPTPRHPDADPGPDDPAELDAAADRDPDAHALGG